jgi:hypothetical protein
MHELAERLADRGLADLIGRGELVLGLKAGVRLQLTDLDPPQQQGLQLVVERDGQLAVERVGRLWVDEVAHGGL